MNQLLKETRTKAELKTFLSDKKDDYLLEQYVQARLSFKEDVRKGRYSAHAENVREALSLEIFRRMAGHKESYTIFCKKCKKEIGESDTDDNGSAMCLDCYGAQD